MLTDLDTILEDVKDIESMTAEPPELGLQIHDFAVKLLSEVMNEENKKVKIITDYDADGICNAYILDKTLHKVKPDIDLEVICNDRRNPYGVPKDLEAEPDTLYIVCDMGSNELDYIRETFGANTFILDHHIINSEANEELFAKEVMLLNPQSYKCEDGISPDYCTTGLAFRIAQNIRDEAEAYERHITESEKIVNQIRKIISKSNGGIIDFAEDCSREGIDVVFSADMKSNAAVFEVTDSSGVYQFQMKLDLADDLSSVDFPYCSFDKSAGLKEINFDLLTMDGQNALLRSAHINQQTGAFEHISTEPFDEVYKNTMGIVAGIGTISDMVDVLDIHSHNRGIIKNAMTKIDNADETNIDFMLGFILKRAEIGEEQVTAKKIGFKVGAFLNSASRMSEVIGANGAQMMYDALAGKGDAENLVKVIDIGYINAERKALMDKLKDDRFYDFIESHRSGDRKDDKIAIYRMDDSLPTAFCGLVAGQITDAVNKPSIAITSHYDKETNKLVYSGSGRNAPKMTSLNDFVRSAVNDAGEDLQITFGGHNDAIGISNLNDYDLFEKTIQAHQKDFVEGIPYPVYLSIKPSEINTPETLEKLRALEPIGNGLKIPPVVLEGKELRRSQGFKSKNTHWKSVQIKDAAVVSMDNDSDNNPQNDSKCSCNIMDWNYSQSCYPTDKSGIIRAMAEMEINDYNGAHVELVAKYNRSVVEGRIKEIEEKSKSAPELHQD